MLACSSGTGISQRGIGAGPSRPSSADQHQDCSAVPNAGVRPQDSSVELCWARGSVRHVAAVRNLTNRSVGSGLSSWPFNSWTSWIVAAPDRDGFRLYKGGKRLRQLPQPISPGDQCAAGYQLVLFIEAVHRVAVGYGQVCLT